MSSGIGTPVESKGKQRMDKEPYQSVDMEITIMCFINDQEKMDKYNTKVYLINTGWSGGSYGTGNRIKLKYTRAMVTAALNGTIENTEFVHNARFNLEVPVSVEGVPSEILDPRSTWEDKAAYDRTADKLAGMFMENFESKYDHMPEAVRAAGPKPLDS